MDFELSQEQRAIGHAVRTWMADRMDLASVREYTDEVNEDIPADLRKAAADLGWLGVAAPDELGGLGLGLVEASLVTEALGGALAPTYVSNTIAAGEVLRLAGDEDQQLTWLEPVVAGTLVPAVALRGEGAAWDASGISVEADHDARLSGDAGVVELAESTDILLVAARCGDDTAVYVVRTDDPGVAVTSVEPIDRTARAARVTLTAVPAERLTLSNEMVLDDIVRRLTVLATADLLGSTQRALDITVDYLKTRHQFGRAIGTFQAVQHEMAELHVSQTTISHGVRYAAYAIDAGLPDRALMTAVVKARASELAKKVAAAMVQFHGAIGFTWEHDAHLFFKRLHRGAYNLGDSDWHRSVIARHAIESVNSHPSHEGMAS